MNTRPTDLIMHDSLSPLTSGRGAHREHAKRGHQAFLKQLEPLVRDTIVLLRIGRGPIDIQVNLLIGNQRKCHKNDPAAANMDHSKLSSALPLPLTSISTIGGHEYCRLKALTYAIAIHSASNAYTTMPAHPVKGAIPQTMPKMTPSACRIQNNTSGKSGNDVCA